MFTQSSHDKLLPLSFIVTTKCGNIINVIGKKILGFELGNIRNEDFVWKT